MDLFSFSEINGRRYKVGNPDGKSNYHTHTLYCDGKNSPEEIVKRALELGFTSIGFSGHQYSVQDAHYAMSPGEEVLYREEILSLKEKYKGTIEIYLGIERDCCCRATVGFDYVIGSCHHVEKDGLWMCVDESREATEEGVRKLFGGDYMAYVSAYYDQEADVLNKTRGQIVGHFDLVTKFNEGNKYFDENSVEYKKLAINSLERICEGFKENKMFREIPPNFPEELAVLLESGYPIFEINTGATISGLRDIPYPAPFIVEHLADIGAPMIFSSDCHDKKYLDFGFQALSHRYGEKY